jgi:hypothetical protein
MRTALLGLTPLARRALDDMLLEAFNAREAAAKHIENHRDLLAKQERIHELANASFVEMCIALDVSGPETQAYLEQLSAERADEFIGRKCARPWAESA